MEPALAQDYLSDERKTKFEILFGHSLSVNNFVRVFSAIDNMYCHFLALLYFKEVYDGELINVLNPAIGMLGFPEHGLIESIKKYNGIIKDQAIELKISKVIINSPGSAIIEGASGVLRRLIDIIHQGDLEREKSKALIEKIIAESRYLNAQALEKEIESLNACVEMLKSAGFKDDVIQSILAKHPNLSSLIGEPFVELQELKESNVLIDINEV